jgi:para-aminobenzoate synthetase/4-amino-4-deoxychorismate lyase
MTRRQLFGKELVHCRSTTFSKDSRLQQQMYAPLASSWQSIAANEADCVLLESVRCDAENHRSFLFCNPLAVLAISALDEVPVLFRHIEQHLSFGHYVAGYFTYECGYHFEPAAGKPEVLPSPLAWFGVYEHVITFDHTDDLYAATHVPTSNTDSVEVEVRDCRLGISEQDYTERLEAIRDYIAAGDTYQVNFTDRVEFEFTGSPVALYGALCARQRVPYSALIHHGNTHILSYSPELFFRISESHIVTRPMKGTAPRGRTVAEDRAVAAWLAADMKNRSENVMIVDLLRNDLGRMCEYGSVRVDDIFAVEKYTTLFQMTSTVSGNLRPGLSMYDVFAALFPCGSVTGAPKVRTMQIIRASERQPRGIYTGAIGFFAPTGESVFSVAIRTLVVEPNRGSMGVGSGIVYDSVAADEYKECRLKAEFLTCAGPPFELTESILWDCGYVLLELHLQRLGASCEYFEFPFNREAVLESLGKNEFRLRPGTRYKVRLRLKAAGQVDLENFAIADEPPHTTIMLAPERTHSNDVFLYHKTTRRELYNRWYAEARQQGYADVIFQNERGEITEGAISNIFIEKDGELLTPPVSSGLLPGVYRAHVIATNPRARECVLRREDLEVADAIYICNAVRGLQKVSLTARSVDPVV